MSFDGAAWVPVASRRSFCAFNSFLKVTLALAQSQVTVYTFRYAACGDERASKARSEADLALGQIGCSLLTSASSYDVAFALVINKGELSEQAESQKGETSSKRNKHTRISCGSVPMNGDPVVAHTSIRVRNPGVDILLVSLIASKVCSTSLNSASHGIPEPFTNDSSNVAKDARPGAPPGRAARERRFS